MTAPAIQSLLAAFDELGDTYLKAEVDQALRQQAELTPHLLAIIESLLDNPLRYVLEGHNGHVYAAFLLAHFREPAAHQLLIRAFSVDEEVLVDLWGDMTTETLPTLLYRTCDGSLTGIMDLIRDRKVDQYVRCAAMEALSYAVAFDPDRRDEVVTFLQGLFTGAEAATDSYFWGNLAATLCDLHPGDSMAVITQAYADNLVTPAFLDPGYVEAANEKTREASQADLSNWVQARMPVDVHAYISWFAEFHQDDHDQPMAGGTDPSGDDYH